LKSVKYKVDDPWANRIGARHVMTRNHPALRLTGGISDSGFPWVARVSTLLELGPSVFWGRAFHYEWANEDIQYLMLNCFAWPLALAAPQKTHSDARARTYQVKDATKRQRPRGRTMMTSWLLAEQGALCITSDPITGPEC
jgi:hypothetical protein